MTQVEPRQHQNLKQAWQVARQGNADANDDERADHVTHADGHHAHGGTTAAGVLVEGKVVEVGEY